MYIDTYIYGGPTIRFEDSPQGLITTKSGLVTKTVRNMPTLHYAYIKRTRIHGDGTYAQAIRLTMDAFVNSIMWSDNGLNLIYAHHHSGECEFDPTRYIYIYTPIRKCVRRILLRIMRAAVVQCDYLSGLGVSAIIFLRTLTTRTRATCIMMYT